MIRNGLRYWNDLRLRKVSLTCRGNGVVIKTDLRTGDMDTDCGVGVPIRAAMYILLLMGLNPRMAIIL